MTQQSKSKPVTLWIHLLSKSMATPICIFSTSKNQRVILISAQIYFYLWTILQFGPEGPDQAGPVVAVSQVGALLILLKETRYKKYVLSITRYLMWSLGPKAHCSPLGQIGLSFVRIVNANAIPRVAAARWSGAFPSGAFPCGAQLGSCRNVKRSESKVKLQRFARTSYDFIWLHRAC